MLLSADGLSAGGLDQLNRNDDSLSAITVSDQVGRIAQSVPAQVAEGSDLFSGMADEALFGTVSDTVLVAVETAPVVTPAGANELTANVTETVLAVVTAHDFSTVSTSATTLGATAFGGQSGLLSDQLTTTLKSGNGPPAVQNTPSSSSFDSNYADNLARARAASAAPVSFGSENASAPDRAANLPPNTFELGALRITTTSVSVSSLEGIFNGTGVQVTITGSIQIEGFFYLSGSFTISSPTSKTVTVKTGVTATPTISGVEVWAFSISATNVFAFVGTGGPQKLDTNNDGVLDATEPDNPDAVGLAISGLNIGLVVMKTKTGITKPGGTLPEVHSFYALRATAAYAGLIGIGDSFQTDVYNIEVNVNTGNPWVGSLFAPIVDFSDAGAFSIPTADSPIVINYADRIMSASASRVTFRISDFIFISGGFSVRKGPTELVTVNTATTTAATFSTISGTQSPTGLWKSNEAGTNFILLHNVPVDTLEFGLSGMDVFVGYSDSLTTPLTSGVPSSAPAADGDLTIAELNAVNAIGVFLDEVTVGLVLMRSVALPGSVLFGSRFFALRINAANVGLIGVPEFQLNASGLEVRLNQGTASWALSPTAVRPVVDFTASFGAGGFAVSTGGSPVALTWAKPLVGVSADNVLLRISDFIYVSGGFSFNKGPTQSTIINTGTSSAAAFPSIPTTQSSTGVWRSTDSATGYILLHNVPVQTIDFGLTGVDVFVGYTDSLTEAISSTVASPAADGDLTVSELLAKNAIGVFLDEVSLGLVLMRATALTLPLAGARFFALKLDASSVALVGVPYVDLTSTNLQVRLNQGTASWATNPTAVRPVVDFVASFGVGGYSVQTSTTNLSPVALKWTQPLIGVSADAVLLKISDFVYVAGGFSFNKGRTELVTVNTGLTSAGVLSTIPTSGTGLHRNANGSILYNVPVETLDFGLSNVDVFIGYSTGFAADGDITVADMNAAGAIGVFVDNANFGLVMMRATGATLAASQMRFMAMKLDATNFQLRGIPEFQLSGTTIQVRLNQGSATWANPLASPPVVDFAASFAATNGYLVQTSTTNTAPVPIAWSTPLIGVSADNVLLRISDFIYVSGGFSFNKGATQSVTVRTGLAASTAISTVPTTVHATNMYRSSNGAFLYNVGVETIDFGLSDVDVFVGYSESIPNSLVNGQLTAAGLASQGSIGVFLENVNLGMVLMRATPLTPTNIAAVQFNAAQYRFLALNLEAQTVALVGIPQFTFTTSNLNVRLNQGSSTIPVTPGAPQPVVDFALSYPDSADLDTLPDGYQVRTSTTNSNPIAIRWDSPLIGVSADKVLLRISDFVYLTGAFSFSKGPVRNVDVRTGLTSLHSASFSTLFAGVPTAAEDPGTTLARTDNGAFIWNLPVETLDIGLSNVDVFVGYTSSLNSAAADGELTLAELETADAIGLFMQDVNFGMTVMRAQVGSSTPGLLAARLQFLAVQGNATAMGLVGVPEIELLAQGAEVRINQGSAGGVWPGVSGTGPPPVVDFKQSFKDNSWGSVDDADSLPDGYRVATNTSGAFIPLLFDQPLIAGGAEKVTIKISEFVHLTGSIYFEKGPVINAPLVAGLGGTVPGVPSQFGGTGNKSIETMTIGASNVHAFVGLDGPYWQDADNDKVIDRNPDGSIVAAEINPRAKGLVIDNLNFGLFIGMPTVAADPVRYVALKATAQQVALVGIDGITASANGIAVELNLSSPAPGGLPALPVINFSALTGGKYSVKTGAKDANQNDVTIDLAMSGPLIRAQGFVNLNIFGSVYLSGSVAFELGPTQSGVTIAGVSGTKTLRTMSIGVANVNAFVGVNGPYWTDTNGNKSVDAGELSTTAIGFSITDLDAGLVVMASTNPSDLGAYVAMKASVTSVGLVNMPIALEANLTFDIAINVGPGTSAVNFAQTFPATTTPSKPAGYLVNTGDATSSVLLNFSGPQINIQLGTTISVGGVFKMNGVFLFDMTANSLKMFANAALTIGPAGDFFSMQAIGVLVINSAGVAADIDLTLSLGSAIPSNEVSFIGVTARLILNTTGQNQSVLVPDKYHVHLTPTALARLTGPAGSKSYVVSGSAPVLFGAPAAAGTYLVVKFGATVRVLGFDFVGNFQLVATATQFQLTADANLELKIGGQTIFSFLVRGAMFINSSGKLAAGIDVQFSAGFAIPSNLGISLTLTYRLEFNTGSAVTLPGVGDIQNGFLVRASGALTVGGVITLNGSYTIAISSTQFTFAIDATVSIFGVSLTVDGSAGLFYGNSPGFALNIALKLGSNPTATVSAISGVFSISGRFTLKLNTTSTERFGVGAQTFEIGVADVSANILGFVLTGTLTIRITSAGLSIPSLALSLNFFNIVTFNVTGYFNADKTFGLTASLSISFLNPDIFGFSGTLAVSFSNSGFGGSLNGTFGAFGIKVSANASFSVDNGIVKIAVGISLQITPAFSFRIWTPWKTYTVNVPALVISGTWRHTFGALTTAPAIPPPPTLATQNGGTLRLNIGADAHYRGSNYDAGDESYSITRIGPNTVRVSALGYDQDFTGVTHIVANDTGNSNNFINIANDVTATVAINVGKTVTGTNRFFTGGGVATIGGGSTSTTVKFGTGGGVFHAGTGQSHITDNSAGLVTVYAPGWASYSLSDKSLNYGDGGSTVHTINFVNVRNVILNGAANASYEVSTLPDPVGGATSPWTGNATFNGSGSSSIIKASTSSNLTLTNGALTESGVSITLNNLTVAELYGDNDVNTFTLSGWTGTGSIEGYGANDTIVASNDTNFTLTNSALSRTNFGTLTLASIETANLTGGNGANSFAISNWSGTANVNGQGGNDSYSITFHGGGAGTVNVTDSGNTDSLTVNGTSGADSIGISGNQVTRSGETVNYSGVESLTVNSLGGGDSITISGTSIPTTVNGGTEGDSVTIDGNTAGLTVNGEAGADIFTVNASGSALTLNGGNDDDTFNIKGLSSPATINTGTGTNRIHVGSAAFGAAGNVNGISGKLTINGDGTDTLNVNDTADSVGNIGLLTLSRLTGLGMGSATDGIEYSFIETLVIGLGTGGNTFNIQSTNANTTTTLNTGGSSTINVGSTAGNASASGGNANGVDGKLNVVGQGAADILNVDDSADGGINSGTLTSTRLTGFGMGSTSDGIEYTTVETINLRLGTGSDTLNVLSTYSGTLTTVYTGTGSAVNIVNLGSLAPSISVNAIAGRLVVNGESSSDTINVNDTDDGSVNTGLLTSTHLTGLGMGVDASKGLQYATIEALNINLGSGGDTFNIQSTYTATLTTVGTGAGSATNTVNVSSATGNVNAIAGKLIVNGQGGSDILNVDDRSDSAGNVGLLTNTRLTGLGMADGDVNKGIEYATIETLNVFLGGGADDFTIQTTHVGVTVLSTFNGADRIAVKTTSGATTINGGDGNDVVNVGTAATVTGNTGGNLDGIQGALTINGEASDDTVNLDDTGDITPNIGTLTSTQLTGLGMIAGGVTYSGLETLNLNLGSAGDTFTIVSTHAALTHIEARAGPDQFTIRSIAGRTEIAGQDGADTITVGNSTLGAFSTVNGIQALLVVTGGSVAGDDTLNVTEFGEAAAASATGTLTTSTLRGLGMAANGGVNYTEFETLNVTLGQGDDTFIVTSTHTTLTNLYAGAGADRINIASLEGATYVRGQAGDDTIKVNVNGDGSERTASGATINGVGALLDLDGENGSDTYIAYLAGSRFSAGHLVSLINANDSGVAGSGSDFLEIYGTDNVTISDNFLVRRNFIALLPPALVGQDASAERINYNSTLNAGVAIYARAGNDTIAFDDNSAAMTVDGGDGNDTFQLGQMFLSERVPGNVASGDEVTTVHTTQGYLTPGIRFATTIYGGSGDDKFVIFSNQGPLAVFGEDGDDSFTVRAFALASSQAVDPNRSNTNINAGQGADFVEYNINAPVAIDGGDGLDKIVVVGTEFSDHIVVTDQGIYGAGLFVTFTGIEMIEIDGAEGDDHFSILSTPQRVVTRLFGGLGSDTFDVGGQGGAVVSRDLQGHSGIIEHLLLDGVTYTGTPVEGVAVDVADNEAAGVVITPTGGTTIVAEVDYGIGLRIDNYTVVLTAPPTSNVYLTASAPVSSLRDQALAAKSVLVYTDAPGATIANTTPSRAVELAFTPANWNVPQTVYVQAVDDAAPEGTRYAIIQHSISFASDPAYGGLAIANVAVQIIDNDTAATVLLPVSGNDLATRIGTVNPLIEGQPALGTQAFALILTKPLVGGEQVTVTLTGSQVGVSASSLVFGGAGGLSANAAQLVTISALNDGVVEGGHRGLITAAVTSNGTTYGAAASAQFEVPIADGNSPSVLILPTNGSTRTIEGGTSAAAKDSYSVVLSQAPAAGQTVRVGILAVPTVTTNNQLLGVSGGIVAQVSVTTTAAGATTETIGGKVYLVLHFTAANWNAPQVVNVAAIDDTTTDGGDIQVFARKLQTVDGIRGPVVIEGGIDPTADRSLANPLLYINERNPDTHSGSIAPNPNFTVIERDQADHLRVYNNDAVAAQSGWLSQSRIAGLGMGGDVTIDGRTFDGGISYFNLEQVALHLGQGIDTFEIRSTHLGETLIDAGGGNDAVAVRSVLGHTTVLGGAGDDHVTLGAPGSSGQTVDRLNALVTIDGGIGSNTVTVDDTADTNDNVGTIDTTTVTGLDLIAARVRVFEIINTQTGTYTLSIDGATTTGLDIKAAGAVEVRAAILALNLSGVADVVVNRAGNTFTVGFLGSEALTNRNLALSVNNLPGIVTESVLNRVQTIALPAASGTFAVNVGAATFNVTVGASADTVRAAIIAALNPTNALSTAGGVGLKDVLVSRFGNTYEVVFQGLLSGHRGNPHTLAVAARSVATATAFSINAIGGTFRLNLAGNPVQTSPLAWNAPAAEVQTVLRNLLNSSSLTVAATGSTYSINFGGSSAALASVDDRNLVAPIAVATRIDGVNYFGVQTLNVSLGAGADVVNIRGTTAITNLATNGGDDRVYVSSLAGETLASVATTDFLRGNLDRILGTLNLDLGTGRHSLMISDEAAIAADGTAAAPVLITDRPVSGLGLPATEITITGLTSAPAITYQAAPSGNFANGITVWTGWGADSVRIDGTHQRGNGAIGSLRTVTTLNTGLGNDTVIVDLDLADGFFALNAQGPEDAYVGHLSDRDVINASTSTRPLVIFGGQDDDTIRGGKAADVIFGDRGLVTYFSGASAVTVLGNGGPGDKTDGIERALGHVTTRNPSVGGNDTVFGLEGRDLVFGGLGNDTLNAASDTDVADDILVGDNGRATFTNGFVTQVETTATDLGGDDTLIAGKGANIAFGGVGNDTIFAGGDNLPDILVGDNGTANFDPTNGRLLEIFTTAPTHAGTDTLTTGDGDSVVIGGSFSDLITSGAGSDIIVGDNGRATFDAVTYRLITITTTVPEQGTTPVRTVDGVLYDDVIGAGAGNNVIFGGSHNDHITTLNGADIVVGDNGSATFDASGILRTIQTNAAEHGGLDRILTGTGADVVFAGSNNDYVDSGSVASGDDSRDVVVGDNGAATFDAAGFLLTITTTDWSAGGNDTILIGGGDNVAFGGVGNDTITAGDGRDVIVGDNGAATFDPITHVLVLVESTRPLDAGIDRIEAANGDNVIVGGTHGDFLRTGTGADVIVGDNGTAVFYADTGILKSIDTTFTSDGGNDDIASGVGGDVVLGGDGADLIDSGSVAAGDDSRDVVVGDNGRATFGPAGNLLFIETTATATGGDDEIFIGGGDNVAFGGVGSDKITADAGRDVIVGDNGSGTFDATSRQLIDVRSTAPTHAGIDTILAGDGRNVVLGGTGDDKITTGIHDDVVVGDNGIALFYSNGVLKSVDTSSPENGGSDIIKSGIGADVVFAGSGADDVDSGSVAAGDISRDIVVGDNGSGRFDSTGNLLFIETTVPDNAGTPANDTILIGGGDNVAFGGVGNDAITADAGRDIIVGDNGSATFDPATYHLIDIRTTDPTHAGTDTILAGDGRNVVLGGTADDRITTGIHDDVVVGDNGVALFYGATGILKSIATSVPLSIGNDIIKTDRGADVVFAGSGVDDVDSGSVAAGDVSRDIVVGDNGSGTFDTLGNLTFVTTTDTGHGAEDTILIGGGNNVAFGGVANDTIIAGDGHDIIVGDNGSATFDPVSYLVANVRTTAPLDGGVDTITAGHGNNIVLGGSMRDVITTGIGDDIVLGDNGYVDFVVNDGAAADIDVVESTDVTVGGNDDIRTSGGSDIVIGGQGDDLIDAGLDNNIVFGDSAKIVSAIVNATNFSSQPFTLGRLETIAPGIGGVDTITTGTGRDIIFGGTAGDIIVANFGETATTPDGDNIVFGDSGYIDFVRAERESTAVGGDLNPADMDVIASLDFADGAADFITTGAGSDIIIGGQAGDTIVAGNGSNIIIGDSGLITAGNLDANRFATQPITVGRIETVAFGIGGIDTITTGSGNDAIFGGEAGDLINAGNGDNVVVGDDGMIDYVRFERDGTTSGADSNAGDIDLIASTSMNLAGGADNITTGSGNDIVIGGRFGDTINAGVGNNLVVADSGRIIAANLDTARFNSGAGTLITFGRIETLQPGDGGDDTIRTGSGRDIILGGPGADTIIANEGETLTASDADNIVLGDDGYIDFTRSERDGNVLGADTDPSDIDVIASTDFDDGGADIITTGNGNDIIIAGQASDRVTAGHGSNVVIGDSGIITAANDNVNRFTTQPISFGRIESTAFGIGGTDTITSGDGNDIVIGGDAADIIDAGQGDNIVAGDDAALEYVRQERENLAAAATPGADLNAGDIDYITSLSTILAGGADTITTGNGNDIIIGGRSGDTITANAGNNIVIGDSGLLTAANQDANRFASLGLTVGRIETIEFGDGGIDTITTLGGNDLILGGHLGDTINAGNGDNVVLGDDGAIDTVRFERDGNVPGADTNAADIDLIVSLSTTLHGGADSITTGSGNDIVIGGRLGDTVTAGEANNIVIGDSGSITAANDNLNRFSSQTNTAITVGLIETIEFGDGGIDKIDSGAGVDVLLGGHDADEINASNGDNVVLGDNGLIDYVRTDRGATGPGVDANAGDIDLILSTSTKDFGGVDHITTGTGNDIVIGGRFGDIITADAGKNIVIGDSGRITAANESINRFSSAALATFTVGLIETITPEDGGRDTITTLGGNDVILGGHLGDIIEAGDGDNVVIGDDGLIDYTRVERGNSGPGSDTNAADIDYIVSLSTSANGGADRITTGGGNDIIVGGRFGDTIVAGNGDNIVVGDSAAITAVTEDAPRFGSHFITVGRIETIQTEHGSNDEIRTGTGQDVLIGGAGDDRLDAGAGHDLVIGDNAILDRTGRVGNFTNPLFQTLSGTLIYDDLANALNNDTPRLQPGGAPIWGDITVTLLDHSFAVQAAPNNRMGNDYIAGGAGNDRIFGGLGDDTIQGDGSIDLVVSARRLADGTLQVAGSVEAATDGDDYIEGNGGNDTIFGGLGQDDIIGGSSNFFGLADRLLRPDGADMIFGGAGTDIARLDAGDTSSNGRARDADVIIGDNGSIVRLVGINNVAGNYLTFGYDNYGTTKIIPRAVEFLDYTPGGADIDAVNAARDIGGADEIHGESGNDTIYGQLGNDVLFGDAQDDDIIGGTGADWISGGNGDDGVLGDDGRIFTSRNGTAEPLNGIAAIPAGGLDLKISTPGKHQEATINLRDELKKTALVEPFHLTKNPYLAGNTSSNDIMFGGLGDDALHGGTGDDAISGAEARPEYYAKPHNSGNVLRWGEVRAGEFAAYNENAPMAKVWVNGAGAFVAAGTVGAVEFILNFVSSEQDGDDVLFGDHGHDWLVGGTGSDNMYGGYGDDLMNADDLHETANGLNNTVDNGSIATDRAFGGAGRDIMIANHANDRLIDWNGEFNSYWVPFSSFGHSSVSRTLNPQLITFLYDLSESDGADMSRALKTNSSAARNGEPNGELGLNDQQDPHYHDQQGAPADPQSGNTPNGSKGNGKG